MVPSTGARGAGEIDEDVGAQDHVTIITDASVPSHLTVTITIPPSKVITASNNTMTLVTNDRPHIIVTGPAHVAFITAIVPVLVALVGVTTVAVATLTRPNRTLAPLVVRSSPVLPVTFPGRAAVMSKAVVTHVSATVVALAVVVGVSHVVGIKSAPTPVALVVDSPPRRRHLTATNIATGTAVHIAIVSPPASASTFTTFETAITVIAAMGIIGSPVPHFRGWPLLVLPLPPAASDGQLHFVGVARGNVVVWPTSDGGSGRVDDSAAAVMTNEIETTANVLPDPSTTSPRHPSLPHDASGTPLVHAGINPALLLIPMDMIASRTNSSGGRGHTSEGPRRTRHFADHSLPPPTVVVVRAAKRGGDRPAVFADTTSATTLPRPGPASLLSSSMWPQRGHIPQQRGRAGTAPRATRKTGRLPTGIYIGPEAV